MACGCSKKAGYRTTKSPATVARSVSGGIAAGPSPAQIRAQQIQSSQLNSGGLSAERRKTQSVRRDAIKRSLNK